MQVLTPRSSRWRCRRPRHSCWIASYALLGGAACCWTLTQASLLREFPTRCSVVRACCLYSSVRPSVRVLVLCSSCACACAHRLPSCARAGLALAVCSCCACAVPVLWCACVLCARLRCSSRPCSCVFGPVCLWHAGVGCIGGLI